MNSKNETWTLTHDLALVYIALAYGTDERLSDEEVTVLKKALSGWDPNAGEAVINEVVVEAMAIHLEDEDQREVTRAMQTLRQHLSEDQRRNALENAVRIAEADGVVLLGEQSIIQRLAEEWDVRATGAELIEQSTVEVEELPAWSLLHDVGLVFVVMAHSTDNQLNDAEITAMIERLQSWQPELSEDEIRKVLREALAFYSSQPDESAIQRSLEAIRENLPRFQRLTLLNDLIYLAESDGEFDEEEKAMFEMFSDALSYGATLDDAPSEA